MRTSVAIFLYRRPEYASQTLAALLECAGWEKIDNVLIFMDNQTPSNDQALEISRLANRFSDSLSSRYPHLFVELRPQTRRVGCNKSIRDGMAYAFAIGSDYVIAVEDDILLAPDALLFFLWAADKYKGTHINTVTSYFRIGVGETVPAANVVIEQAFFSPWGWATWKSQWMQHLAPALADVPERLMSWDTHMYARMNKKMFLVVPVLSRAQNIGLHHGEHMDGNEKLFLEHMHTPIWAGGQVPPPCVHEYIELATPQGVS